jgi:hypothetical protein
MALIIIAGLPGTGKSLQQFHYACKMANRNRSILVSNVPFNFPAFRRYCGLMNYGWLAHCIDSNQIIVKPGVENICELFEYRNAWLLIDELGVFFNARAFGSMPKKILFDLAQTRKSAINIVGACQYWEQIDKSFRLLSTTAVHSCGMTIYSRELKNEALILKKLIYFDPIKYERWLEDKKARSGGLGGFFRTRFQYAIRVEEGRLKEADYQAFKCFKSFDRLESAKAFENPYFQKPYQEINFADADLPALIPYAHCPVRFARSKKTRRLYCIAAPLSQPEQPAHDFMSGRAASAGSAGGSADSLDSLFSF